MSDVPEDLYDDDEDHPIPFVNSLDIFARKVTGGATLVVSIATPLKADERSQRRLLQKIENYLGFINGEEFLAEVGVPSKEDTEIEVLMHPDTDPEISELLGRCVEWIEENNAKLRVTRR